MRILLILFSIMPFFLVFCFGPLNPYDPAPQDINDTTQQQPSGNELSAYWACNDSGNTLKDQQGTFNGSIVGAAPAEGVDSSSGGALQFDGSGNRATISTRGKTGLNLGTGNFTVSLWVNPQTFKAPTDSTRYDIISNGVAWERGFTISIYKTSFNAFVGQNRNQLSDTTFDATEKTWRHLVLVRRNSVVELYVDVQKIVSYANNNDVSTADSQIIIGDDASNRDDNQFIGFIDEIKIDNAAWDLAAIRSEYNAHK